MPTPTRRTTPKKRGQIRGYEIELNGERLVLDHRILNFIELPRWRRIIAEQFGDTADEKCVLAALALVMLQRTDPTLTAEEFFGNLNVGDLEDALTDGTPIDDSPPEGDSPEV